MGGRKAAFSHEPRPLALSKPPYSRWASQPTPSTSRLSPHLHTQSLGCPLHSLGTAPAKPPPQTAGSTGTRVRQAGAPSRNLSPGARKLEAPPPQKGGAARPSQTSRLKGTLSRRPRKWPCYTVREAGARQMRKVALRRSRHTGFWKTIPPFGKRSRDVLPKVVPATLHGEKPHPESPGSGHTLLPARPVPPQQGHQRPQPVCAGGSWGAAEPGLSSVVSR